MGYCWPGEVCISLLFDFLISVDGSVYVQQGHDISFLFFTFPELFLSNFLSWISAELSSKISVSMIIILVIGFDKRRK